MKVFFFFLLLSHLSVLAEATTKIRFFQVFEVLKLKKVVCLFMPFKKKENN